MSDQKQDQELDRVSGGIQSTPIIPIFPPKKPPTNPIIPVGPIKSKTNPVG
jgi:hypothetical protein